MKAQRKAAARDLRKDYSRPALIRQIVREARCRISDAQILLIRAAPIQDPLTLTAHATEYLSAGPT